MNCNLFPEYTKHQKLIQEGFDLLYPSLYQHFTDIWEKELIGEPQKELRELANKLYYELYRLAEWLVEVDRYIERCNKGCIQKQESDKIKEKFLITCPLICLNDKSLELIKLFESNLPFCSNESYRWIGEGVCDSANLVYRVLELVQNGVKRFVIVPLHANTQYYLDLGIPSGEVTRLINSRLIQSNHPQCCPYPAVNMPYVRILSLLQTAVSFEYHLNNGQATGVFELNGQVQTVNQPSGTIIFSSLTPTNSYTLKVTVSNCAGSLSLTLPFDTPPYVLTIQIGVNLQGNIQLLNGLVVGGNVITTYCSQVVVAFQGINVLHKITKFEVDGQDKLNEVVFTQIVNGYNVGGSFTFPCFDKDTTIFIDGERLFSCDDINLSVTGNTITISV
ncbi:MAG: hypothetical protein NZZ41_02295 [Candidatus Dojkabacteria bacterium]|nr:hypothetical protein [Candidatus Dojkabacteria bacterium]